MASSLGIAGRVPQGDRRDRAYQNPAEERGREGRSQAAGIGSNAVILFGILDLKKGLTTGATIAALAIGLSACDGGGDGGSGSGATGLFLDAEVDGLQFASIAGSGSTDANGTYFYAVGQPITFSIGGVVLGTVAGNPACTPRDFGSAQNSIARFLQTLDADGDPSNGIDLNSAVANLANTNIPASAFAVDATTFGNDASIAAAISTGRPGATLVSAASATAALNAGTVISFDKNELAGNGFMLVLPADNDIGYVGFDSLVNPTDDGSMASILTFSDTIVGGGDGEGTDYFWHVDANSDLVLIDEDDPNDTLIAFRQGSSSSGIGFTFRTSDSSRPEAATLLIPTQLTAFDVAGGNSKNYQVDTPFGTLDLALNADGTLLLDQAETGTWTLDPNGVLVWMTLNPGGDQIGFIVVSGNLSSNGLVLVADGSDFGGNGMFEDLYTAAIRFVP